MNLYVNDGTRPNPLGLLKPINTMPNGGYRPSQGGIPDFIPLDAGLLIKRETDKNPSRYDLRLFDVANNPDITKVMYPCKTEQTIDIINSRLKRRNPLKDTAGQYPTPYGARNQPVGLAQEKDQVIAKNLNVFDSNYPNKMSSFGRRPN